MDPFVIGGFLATLASGLITLTLLASRPEIRRLGHFGGLIANVLLFNLLVILGLAWQILSAAVWKGAPDRPASPPGMEVLVAVLLVLGLLKLGWAYSFMKLALRLLDRTGPAVLKALFGTAGGGLVVLAGSAWAPFLGEARHAFVGTVFLVLEYAVLAVVIVTAVVLMIGAGRYENIRERRAAAVLGGIYFVLFTGSLVFIATAGNGARGAGETYRWINVLGLLLYNPALYIWARKSAEFFRYEPPEILYQPNLVIRYGISGREFEIIALICEGRSNREIADRLCISTQTVKDHNYNIFKKTGVKNRTQLARLFMIRTGA